MDSKFYFAPGRGATYLRWASLHVCLSHCLLAYFKNHMPKLYQIFCTWPRLHNFLTTSLRYVIYFRFCGWRHVIFAYWSSTRMRWRILADSLAAAPGQSLQSTIALLQRWYCKYESEMVDGHISSSGTELVVYNYWWFIAGTYFIFVMIMCAVSLSSSIAVMYVHNRSSGHDASLAMPNWVNLSVFSAFYRATPC